MSARDGGMTPWENQLLLSCRLNSLECVKEAHPQLLKKNRFLGLLHCEEKGCLNSQWAKSLIELAIGTGMTQAK